jgi:hypothetical protein
MNSPANREHLEKAIQDVEQSRNIRYYETLEEAIACVQPEN